MTIYLTDLKGIGSIPRENIDCTFTASSFDLKIMGLNRKNYRLKKGNVTS